MERIIINILIYKRQHSKGQFIKSMYKKIIYLFLQKSLKFREIATLQVVKKNLTLRFSSSDQFSKTRSLKFGKRLRTC